MIRQLAVDLILWFWRIMPRRTRLWAFMNDGPLASGVKTWWGR